MKIYGDKIKDGIAIKSSVKELHIKFMKTILRKVNCYCWYWKSWENFRDLIGNSIKSICDLNLIFVSLSIKRKTFKCCRE